MQLLRPTLTVCLLWGCFLTAMETHCQVVPRETTILPEGTAPTLQHRFYLIGDAGNAKQETVPAALSHLQRALETETNPATVLFLGDNIYPAGMPEKKHPGRALSEQRLSIQLNAVKNFKGRVIFIPGNHDWYAGGTKGLRREEDFVEDRLGKKTFLPGNGCPIASFDVGDNIVVIVVDSQWYITDWDRDKEINRDCYLTSRSRFLDEFRHEIKKARGKTTIVAVHHPMFTNGSHGGYYSLRSHLLPVPVLGSIYNILRRTTGLNEGDLQYKFYRELQQQLTAAAQQNDKVIFVSGHEHNLQYTETDNLRQIVSGSGSKLSAVHRGGLMEFGAEVPGYAILDVMSDGTVNVRFLDAQSNDVLFQKNIIKAQEMEVPVISDSVPKTATSQIYTTEETNKGTLYRRLWGARYRSRYGEPIEMRPAVLDTLRGGLEPFRMGGGNQSRSLFLRNKEGREYVIRALRKNAAQYLQSGIFKGQYVQDKLAGTKTEALIQDVFTGSYPFAPLVASELSEAASLPHFHPQLLYLPKQPQLGVFNEAFGNELCLIEERDHPDGFELIYDYTGKSLGTYEVIEHQQKDRKSRVDEEAFIRTRLFDMLIGDWDRHQDQWRWLETKKGEETVFVPVARDRDQAFSKMSDGWLLGAAVRLIPAARLLRKYERDIHSIEGFNREAYPMDVALCVESGSAVWLRQAAQLQRSLTDEAIDEAFSVIPSGKDTTESNTLKEILRARRDNLTAIAQRYADVISRVKVITGSVKADTFRISSDAEGNLDIVVSVTGSSGASRTFLHQTYKADTTKEIWLYGLDGADRFEIEGRSSKIGLRIVGGRGEDVYEVEDAKNIHIYDYKNPKEAVSNVDIVRTDAYEVNAYDVEKIRTDTNQLIPTLGFNPDDGIKLGIADTYTRYGFRRNPFSERHNLRANAYFATGGFELGYRLEVAHLLGDANLVVKAGVQSPNFTINFFGYGNRSVNDDDERGMDFNRVRMKSAFVGTGFIRRGRLGSSFEVGFIGERISIENTPNRWISEYFAAGSSVFKTQTFIGVNSSYRFENIDNKAYPTLGIVAELDGGYRQAVEGSRKSTLYAVPMLRIDHRLSASGNWVIATVLKAHLNFKDSFELYQAASIGGFDGLRGYRNQRFTGRSSFYQNTDIRYSFNQVKTDLIPLRYGVFGGFDYGRVWFAGDDSEKWHTSAGGGFFLNGSELISASFGLFNGSDGNRVTVSLGFSF